MPTVKAERAQHIRGSNGKKGSRPFFPLTIHSEGYRRAQSPVSRVSESGVRDFRVIPGQNGGSHIRKAR